MIIYEECTKDMVIPKGLGRNGGMKEYKAGKNIQIIEDVINCTIDTDKLSTKTDVDEKIENSLTGYATEEYVQQQVIEAGSVTTDIVEEMIDESLLNYYTQTETDAEIEEKINNQTFKTINGESIKGEGNIEIQGGQAIADAGSETQPVYFKDGAAVPVKHYSTSDETFKSFVPYVRADGVMEVGQYLDFHAPQSNPSNDFDARMSIDGNDTLPYYNKRGTSLKYHMVLSEGISGIWKGTKVEYNALSVIDNNTLYIIQN